MAVFKIHPNDYVDLKENLSEKNIINTVEGREYIVTSIQGTQLDSRVVTPDTLNKIFTQVGFTSSGAKYNPELIVYSSYAEAGLYGYAIDKDFARTETLYVSGKYEFTTDEVIESNDSIGCSFIINYTKSSTDSLTNNIYNINNATAFFSYGGHFPMLMEEGDNNLSTNKFIPAEQSIAIAQFLWGKADAIAQMPATSEYCTARIKNRTASSTVIEVSYRFKIWAAWATDNQTGNTALAVNSITVNTLANTVDTEEINFSYQDDLVNTERKYELETNELFQTTFDTAEDDKLSHQTYEKIINRYNIDRRIITFDLLNPLKIQINDGDKYENGNNQERYLDTDDEFDIYDEYDKLIGTFKVIQSNPIWDGVYHKIITAILMN